MSVMTLLFIPVSSLEGFGEYTRSLIIAKKMKEKWPFLKIYFALNENVSYITSCPFEVFTTEHSPTKDSHAVNVLLEKIKPDFVLFDASGRAHNFEKAKAIGAKVAFISQHEKKRSRGLKLNRLRFIDQHWVVQPTFAIEPLSLYQRCKLKLLMQDKPKNIGSVFEHTTNESNNSILKKYNIPTDFFIFNAGSGGHKKSNQYCIESFYYAAKAFSEKSGIHCMVVLGGNYPKALPNEKNLTCVKSVEHTDFMDLLIAAKGRVISAGDTVLQCIALQLPSISVAVSSDQPKRLKACAENELVLASELNEQEMIEKCHQLLRPSIYQSLQEKMITHQTEDALSIITNDIAELLNLPSK